MLSAEAITHLNSHKIRERYVKDVIDLIILKALEEGPKGAYDIMGYVHNKFQVLLSPGTVYPMLAAMEQQNVVKSSIASKKRLYMLTEEGKERIKILTSEYMTVQRMLTFEETKLG